VTLLRRAEQASEYLDEASHPEPELEQSLGHVAAVNRWLGGERALLRHLAPLVRPGRTVRILDVGTGSGDLPRAIVRWARRHDRNVHVTATDVHPQMVALARRYAGELPEIDARLANALDLPFADHAFDIALLGMTLHHFEGDAQRQALRELARVGRRIVVGELERTIPNYLGARLLALTLWRGNRLTRHDGPLSVRRAFTPAELLDLAREAGVAAPRVHRHVFYRLVLTGGE
jgi:SAM-dependent methyltransferase